MKITKKLLKQLIKEEILNEVGPLTPGGARHDAAMRRQRQRQKEKEGGFSGFKAEDTPQEPPRFKAEDTPQAPPGGKKSPELSYKEIPQFPPSLHGQTVKAQLSGNTISFKTNEGNFKLEVTGRGVRGYMGIEFTITPELKISSSSRFINGRKILKILMSK